MALFCERGDVFLANGAKVVAIIPHQNREISTEFPKTELYTSVLYLFYVTPPSPTGEDWSLSRQSSIQLPISLLFHLFSRKKVSKKRRGDKFSGSPLVVGKTDACAFLLREKFSVS